MEPTIRILTTFDRHLSGPSAVRLMGGAAMILAYGRRRMTEDVDLLLRQEEAEYLAENCDLGPALEATNAELEPEGLYLTHIWGPEQQILTPRWAEDCRAVTVDGLVHLRVTALGPLDLLVSKLCRADDGDLADLAWLIGRERLTRGQVVGALDAASVPREFHEVWPRNRDRALQLL